MRTTLSVLSAVAIVLVLAWTFNRGPFRQTVVVAGVPGLSGVWDSGSGQEKLAQGIGGPGYAFDALGAGRIPRNGFLAKADPQPPMQPLALERFGANNGGLALGAGSILGANSLDPSKSCFPPGPVQIYAIPYPVEIVQRPDEVVLLSEYDHWVRRIRLDQRQHPDGYPVSWMGHSIGRYEGDVLMVDTVGMNDKTWIDDVGHPHTEALHLTERYRRTGPDMLEIQIVVDDPMAYTKPWTGRKLMRLMPSGYRIMEHVACEEYLELGKQR